MRWKESSLFDSKPDWLSWRITGIWGTQTRRNNLRTSRQRPTVFVLYVLVAWVRFKEHVRVFERDFARTDWLMAESAGTTRSVSNKPFVWILSGLMSSFCIQDITLVPFSPSERKTLSRWASCFYKNHTNVEVTLVHLSPLILHLICAFWPQSLPDVLGLAEPFRRVILIPVFCSYWFVSTRQGPRLHVLLI